MNLDKIDTQFKQFNELAGKIAKLSQAQYEAIQIKDFETVEFILNSKQTLINELLNASDFRDMLNGYIVTDSPSAERTWNPLVKQYLDCLQQIRQQEEQAIELVQREHQSLSEKLRSIARSNQSTQSYSLATPTQNSSQLNITS